MAQYRMLFPDGRDDYKELNDIEGVEMIMEDLKTCRIF